VDEEANEPAVILSRPRPLSRSSGASDAQSFAVGSNAAGLDEAIAEMVYGCNLGFSLVSARVLPCSPPSPLALFILYSLFILPTRCGTVLILSSRKRIPIHATRARSTTSSKLLSLGG